MKIKRSNSLTTILACFCAWGVVTGSISRSVFGADEEKQAATEETASGAKEAPGAKDIAERAASDADAESVPENDTAADSREGETEPKSRRDYVMELFDVNRDGVLQREEFQAMAAQLRAPDPEKEKAKRQLPKRALERQRQRDSGQPVLRGARLRLIEKFDKNRDGKLSEPELEAARAYLKERRAGRPGENREAAAASGR